MSRQAVALSLLLAACAGQPQPPQQQPTGPDGLLPGSIGLVAVTRDGGLTVAALRKDGAAARAGVRPGDVVLSYNGMPLSTPRDFNRRVLDTPPGSVARLELLHDGERRVLDIPMHELDTMPRV